MIYAIISIGAPLLLVIYLVLAYSIKRVTYIGDGTRITWYPLMPGMWVEEGKHVGKFRDKEEFLVHEAFVVKHIEKCRQIAKANRRRIRPERSSKPAVQPLGKRVSRLTERAAKAALNSLR